MSAIDEWFRTHPQDTVVTAGDLISLLTLLPPEEPVMFPDGYNYAGLTVRHISVGEKSDRLYIDVP